MVKISSVVSVIFATFALVQCAPVTQSNHVAIMKREFFDGGLLRGRSDRVVPFSTHNDNLPFIGELTSTKKRDIGKRDIGKRDGGNTGSNPDTLTGTTEKSGDGLDADLAHHLLTDGLNLNIILQLVENHLREILNFVNGLLEKLQVPVSLILSDGSQPSECSTTTHPSSGGDGLDAALAHQLLTNGLKGLNLDILKQLGTNHLDEILSLVNSILEKTKIPVRLILSGSQASKCSTNPPSGDQKPSSDVDSTNPPSGDQKPSSDVDLTNPPSGQKSTSGEVPASGEVGNKN